MIECGFCGGTLTRRSWHSSSQYNKAIWQCVVSTKKEKVLPGEQGRWRKNDWAAFVESYRLLCQNNKDVLDEFMKRTEETLSESNAGKRLAKAERDIHALEVKKTSWLICVLKIPSTRRPTTEVFGPVQPDWAVAERVWKPARCSRNRNYHAQACRHVPTDTWTEWGSGHLWPNIFWKYSWKVIRGTGYDSDGNKDPTWLSLSTRPGSRTAWTARISSRFARIARRTTPLLFCVPMLLTRLNLCVPILATTHIEVVCSMVRVKKHWSNVK